MRPGVSDTLAGIRRILDDIIAPEVREGYPTQVLRGVVKNLAMLENAWVGVLPFLQWDNDATAALLDDAAEYVDAGLASRIAQSREHDTDLLSATAMEERNAALRGLLAEVIPQLMHRDHAADVQRRVTEHLIERMNRYPFSMAVAAPTRAHKK